VDTIHLLRRYVMDETGATGEKGQPCAQPLVRFPVVPCRD
jgi:hypothetical protein